MLTYQLLFSVTTSDVKPINSQNSHTIIICSNWKKKKKSNKQEIHLKKALEVILWQRLKTKQLVCLTKCSKDMVKNLRNIILLRQGWTKDFWMEIWCLNSIDGCCSTDFERKMTLRTRCSSSHPWHSVQFTFKTNAPSSWHQWLLEQNTNSVMWTD